VSGPRWASLARSASLPLLLLAVVAVALAVGKYPLSPAELAGALLSRLGGHEGSLPEPAATVLWSIRLPRVAAGLLVGAALAAAGAAYQGMFRNPLVSPDILGVSAGAGLGALLGIYLDLPVALVQLLAFAGGLLAVLLVSAVATRVRRHDPVLVLVLSGMAVGTVLGAAMSLLKILADPYTQLPAMTYWLLGGLHAATPADAAGAAPGVAAGLATLALLRWRMNLLSLPDEEVLSMGVDPARLRLALVAAATLMTASAVSVSGVVGWVGLVVPHVARMLVGPDFRRLLPASTMLGAGFLVAADTVARTAAPIELPLGILTALAGAPFFLWLLSRARRAW
jgi:iron complex transport system permease protein